ncbi:hypothetical protein TTHERM_00081070 (macronuclear) [Tetrahymena thermophila SB210]|uniref:Transmembrane protein n=1 Tax=Tetrahymena thermophila (strain SB210) TaxID=312017 RepID=Q23FK7_TETTS|nr:hypothetical protein TTHERM_00081070 [Tetrahymena thermophila SB210]EAR95603.2 hypothetical protein TTHERM_00081070 [Tetrahymena thermophila SB210]|eukprot:XP_001015848.2 hypothetical protein TTHERM_00081070 [Tetrahymena thermophila SB210]
MIVLLTFFYFFRSAHQCTYTGFLAVFGSYVCPFQVQVGSPGQQLTLSIAINRILPKEEIQSGMSFLLTNECILQRKCISLIPFKQFGTAFNPELTISLNKTGINYSNIINGSIQKISGEYSSDLFQISEEIEQKIRIPFLLVDSVRTWNPISGILNFERHNINSLILQGYLQNQLKTPKFAITTENKVGKLYYDEIPKYLNNAIEIKTKSSDLWDLKIIGLLLEDKDVLPLAHFYSLEFTLYPFTQLPKGIANYLLKKYSHLLTKHENTVNLQDCGHCSCLEKHNFPDLKIFTEKVMITLTPKQYFSVDQYANFICQIVISMDKIMLSSQFYQDHPTIFNTKNGSVAIFNILVIQAEAKKLKRFLQISSLKRARNLIRFQVNQLKTNIL